MKDAKNIVLSSNDSNLLMMRSSDNSVGSYETTGSSLTTTSSSISPSETMLMYEVNNNNNHSESAPLAVVASVKTASNAVTSTFHKIKEEQESTVIGSTPIEINQNHRMQVIFTPLCLYNKYIQYFKELNLWHQNVRKGYTTKLNSFSRFFKSYVVKYYVFQSWYERFVLKTDAIMKFCRNKLTKTTT